jgi:hypothetical protein
MIAPLKLSVSSRCRAYRWSGYFTSRPSLKGNSQAAVSRLLSAEILFALHTDGPADRKALWKELEVARRNNGIVQVSFKFNSAMIAFTSISRMSIAPV